MTGKRKSGPPTGNRAESSPTPVEDEDHNPVVTPQMVYLALRSRVKKRRLGELVVQPSSLSATVTSTGRGRGWK